MASIGNMTNSILDGIVREVQKDENQKKLRCNVLDPVAKYLENHLKPYFFALLILLLIMIGVMLWILKIALSVKSVVRAAD